MPVPIHDNDAVSHYRINPTSYVIDGTSGLPIPEKLDFKKNWNFNQGNEYTASVNCTRLLSGGEADNHTFGQLTLEYKNKKRAEESKPLLTYDGYDRYEVGPLKLRTDSVEVIIENEPETIPETNVLNAAHCLVILEFVGRREKKRMPRKDWDEIAYKMEGIQKAFVPKGG